MIELSEKEQEMSTTEWMRAERAVSLTNEQIVNLKAYFDLTQDRWVEKRAEIMELAKVRNADGSLAFPRATKALNGMDEIESKARAGINRIWEGRKN